MKSPFKSWIFRLAIVALLPFLLESCGSSYSAPPGPTTYTIGGMVSGLSGTGLVLQDNGGNNLSITANGTFTFTTAVSGSYDVTVSTQPSNPAQDCVATKNSGTASANVTNVQVDCTTPSFTIGGTVSGLTGTGLVLQDNGGDNFTASINGNFTFATAVSSGGAYAVTVFSYPSGPVQNCTVTNGSGSASADVTNVQVVCTNGFTIGGVVTNLSSTGLVLQDNGGNSLSVTANGAFTFTEPVDSGSAYAITVSTQPSSPTQLCSVADATGSANATVTNVAVNCGHNEFAWMNGSNTANPNGNNGVYPANPGTTNATNVPGSRNFGSVSWTDTSGNLWLFGGNGNDSVGTVGDLNDLWKYNIASGEWTWVSGSNLANQSNSASYGALNTANSTNVPGDRDSAVSWIDSSGNLWLFGGEGYDSAQTFGYLNDLWEYSIANNEWTWRGGSNVVNQPGNYGALTVAATTNIPGSRGFATVQNINGVVWLFGGFGNDSTPLPGQQDNLNDLWQYSGGEWTWMGGSDVIDGVGNYGTVNMPTTTTVPGSRYSPATWTDTSGNLWLFGGSHEELTANVDYFNDLWEYSTVNNEWTWKGGQSTLNQNGNYGTQGTAASTNLPGARADMSSWTDPSGNFWLFGGFGYDVNPTNNPVNQVDLNDLWEYSVTANEWTWQKGMNTGDQAGVYGTLGQLAPLNIPGNREGAPTWTDSSGNLWLFAGSGTNAINDLWMYFP